LDGVLWQFLKPYRCLTGHTFLRRPGDTTKRETVEHFIKDVLFGPGNGSPMATNLVVVVVVVVVVGGPCCYQIVDRLCRFSTNRNETLHTY